MKECSAGLVCPAGERSQKFMCCQLSRLLPETAFIEKVKEYNLWVGDVRVTNRNKNDIMNDGGKVKFDPETGTLTLDDPEIIGKYNCFCTTWDALGVFFSGSLFNNIYREISSLHSL